MGTVVAEETIAFLAGAACPVKLWKSRGVTAPSEALPDVIHPEPDLLLFEHSIDEDNGPPTPSTLWEPRRLMVGDRACDFRQWAMICSHSSTIEIGEGFYFLLRQTGDQDELGIGRRLCFGEKRDLPKALLCSTVEDVSARGPGFNCVSARQSEGDRGNDLIPGEAM